jgi:hypothetical protein
MKTSNYMGVHMSFMCENREQVFRLGCRCISASVPFLGVVYNSICIKSFSTFACVPLKDGAKVLVAAPAVICWNSAEHNAMVAYSIVALIVYVFGVPAMTIGTILFCRQRDLLKNPIVLGTIGSWYTWFGACTPWPAS